MSGLGFFVDNINLPEKAIAYLKQQEVAHSSH